MSALVQTAELKQPGQFECSWNVVLTLLVVRGLAHHLVIFRTKRINCGIVELFAYYAGPDAVKGLQRFHDKGEKVSTNALKKLGGIILPEFYKKVAAEMQEGKTTLKSLQKSFDNIILEQWISMHLDHPGNGKYVRSEKGVGCPKSLGSVSTRKRDRLFFLCSAGNDMRSRKEVAALGRPAVKVTLGTWG